MNKVAAGSTVPDALNSVGVTPEVLEAYSVKDSSLRPRLVAALEAGGRANAVKQLRESSFFNRDSVNRWEQN